MTVRHGRKNGFTLVEVLLSVLLLAIGTVVICGVSRRCLENHLRGMEYARGWMLLDETLEKIQAQGIKKGDSLKVREGDFSGRYPGYRYTLEISAGKERGIYDVYGQVWWQVAGQRYQVGSHTRLHEKTPVSKGTGPEAQNQEVPNP